MKHSISTLIAATTLLLAAPVFAQNSGTSHPEKLDDTITVTAPQNAVVTVQAPAPAPAPALQTRPTEEVYVAPTPAPAQYAPQPAQVRQSVDPADAGIVTDYPYDPNALVEGTLIKARLVGSLSTETTPRGTSFVATLTESVLHDGRVILPAGASLEGLVTEVRGGKRLTGGSALHIVPETVTLPDGTQYRIAARLIDLDAGHSARVNDEGTIVGGDHTKGHVVTLGATTGGGAIAGAVVGGGVGAAVGAGIGAGVGTVLWLNQDRQQTLPEGTKLIFSLNRPMELTPAPPLQH